MPQIQSLKADALSATPASPGIARHLAFKGDDCMVVRSRADPGVVSGWHHHGDYEVYGYIVSGTLRMEGRDGEGNAVSLSPGDFLHVPAHTVHREINTSSDEGEAILFLRGSGPLVINVDDANRG